MKRGDNGKSLVLFDIDGTLVDVKGAGRRSFIRAIKSVWDIDDALDDVKFGGATDLGVLAQLRQRLALDVAKERAFFRAMAEHLLDELSRDKPRVYDGVHACLDRFSDDDTQLGFVTGNAMRCAHVKVEQAGIDFSRFDIGGYGDEHHDRCELAALAKARAERAQGAPFARVLLIGDTPSDILAARSIGAVAVGVTTGHASRDALVAAGADVVVDSLDSLR